MPHPAMSPNNVAVITGGASGIGLAAATHFASLGMKVCIADIGVDRLTEAAARLASVAKGGAADIMTPPGNPAYNVSKAGVKAQTEALQHELRNIPGCRISAHLMIPGHVFTPLTARGRTEKPPGAWTAEQTVNFMIARIEAGDFYILCPDNDVPRPLDERRT